MAVRDLATVTFTLLACAVGSVWGLVSYDRYVNWERVRVGDSGDRALALVSELRPLNRLRLGDLHQLGAFFDGPDIGFGARRFHVRNVGDDRNLRLEGVMFQQRIFHVRLAISRAALRWSEEKLRTLRQWKEYGGPAFECTEFECAFEVEDTQTLGSLKNRVAKHLGEQTPIDVPKEIESAYRYLLLPYESGVIAERCGIAGTPTPEHVAIHALFEKGSLATIINVLKGYSPEGRIYALILLTQLQRTGMRLDPDVLTTMEKVRSLPVKVASCSGCVITESVTAADILTKWIQWRHPQ